MRAEAIRSLALAGVDTRGALVDIARVPDAAVPTPRTLAGVSRGEDNMLIVDLADGRRIRVAFRTLAQTPETFGARSALRFDMDGRAVIGQEGYGLVAHAIVDVKTRAFLEVSCEIRWRDRAG